MGEDLSKSKSADARTVLNYADSPTHHGIVFERVEDGVRVTAPPKNNEHWLWSVFALPLTVLLNCKTPWLIWPEIRAIPRNGKPIVIEATSSTLSVFNLRPMEPNPDIILPRGLVQGVAYDAHWDNAVVSVNGGDTITLHFVDDPQVQLQLVEVLRDGLKLA